ncbi:MAG TPA: hypothetical protein VHZ24_20785 [Pirellulales bacterium]|nr:hypothetical protein [Pirellulales bacterium]
MPNTTQLFAFDQDVTGGLLTLQVGGAQQSLDPTAGDPSASQAALDALFGAGNAAASGTWSGGDGNGVVLELKGDYTGSNVPLVAYTSTLANGGVTPAQAVLNVIAQTGDGDGPASIEWSIRDSNGNILWQGGDGDVPTITGWTASSSLPDDAWFCWQLVSNEDSIDGPDGPLQVQLDNDINDTGASVQGDFTPGATSVVGVTQSIAQPGGTVAVPRATAVAPSFVERPTTGAATYAVDLYLSNLAGAPFDADALPLLIAKDQADGDLGSALSAVTHTAQGHYQATFSQSAADTSTRQVRFAWSATVTGIWLTAAAASVVADKTGYQLSADGLDAIAITAPPGVATTFREMVVQTWRRFFARATKTSIALTTYADDGATVVTAQSLSDDGTTQVQGPAA